MSIQNALQLAKERKLDERAVRLDDRIRNCADLLDRIQHEMSASDDVDVVWMAWNVRYCRDFLRGSLVLLED